jgi:hypothetical protein
VRCAHEITGANHRMATLRRAVTPGATYFFTVDTYRRQALLTDPPMCCALCEARRGVKRAHPFTIDAFVLLPGHLHCLWLLPQRRCKTPSAPDHPAHHSLAVRGLRRGLILRRCLGPTAARAVTAADILTSRAQRPSARCGGRPATASRRRDPVHASRTRLSRPRDLTTGPCTAV